MEAKIQKQIIDYFSFFEEFYNTSKTCLKDCQKCAVTINKLIIRCKNIKEAEVIESPLQEFHGLQSKLYLFLTYDINEEIEAIKTHLNKIEDLLDKLCHKYRTLNESCRGIDYTENSKLVKGTPLQPSLQTILEFSEETVNFGSQICAQIQTSLSVLSIKELNTKAFTENFKIISPWQNRIPEILAYTAYCSENQV